MNARKRPMVLLYALGSVVVIGALALVTVTVLRQQAAHARAVADALHQEDIRTALWRMETRLGSLLAMTTSRASVAPPAPGTFAQNSLEIPNNLINPDAPPAEGLAQELISAADQAYLVACAPGPGESDPVPPQAWTNPEQQVLSNRGVQRSADEYLRRGWSNMPSQVSMPTEDRNDVCVGPLATLWDRSGGELELQFARRIQTEGGASHESYRISWDELSGLLLAEIVDLFPTAQLEPIDAAADGGTAGGNEAELALRLAAVPARLVVPPPLPAEGLPRDHVWALAGAWAALLVSLCVGGLALRSSYAYGDKHRRFTHAVTHELRTPLTTFRLYSEMLARGMVPAAKQPEYLATLETESARLARLVDNVLRYARIEEGRKALPRDRIAATSLVERCVPELARTCAAHGAQLEVEDLLDGDAQLLTDADAVLQVLSNLVENACKYGRAPGTPATAVRLRIAREGARLALDISDEGPGIPPAVERAIFEPFDRGGRDPSDPSPGVGLGLALSRALAGELGGSLTLEPSARGARFRLVLPLLG